MTGKLIDNLCIDFTLMATRRLRSTRQTCWWMIAQPWFAHFSSRHAGLLRERSSECILWTVQDHVALQSSGLQNKTQIVPSSKCWALWDCKMPRKSSDERVSTSYQSHTGHHPKILGTFVVCKSEAQTQNTSSLNYEDEKNSRSLELQVLSSNIWNI